MQLGFVHFDRSDQRKYLAVLSRISEGGAIDELGIGRIRDFFSDLLFPGVSSLHQHAKYFSLMPLLYWEAVKYKYEHLEDVRPRIVLLEKELTRRLCEGSPGAPGITGSDALKKGSFVKYDPMYIYGMALRTYGIVRTDNLEGAIFDASRKAHERPVKLSATDQEQRDSDDVDGVLKFCDCPSDLEYNWLEKCSLNLTPNEATWLRRHILSSKRCKDSLLYYLLDNRLEVPPVAFEDYVEGFSSSLPGKLVSDLERAVRFSSLVEGLYLFYNWLYSNKTHEEKLQEFLRWHEEVFSKGAQAMADALKGVQINDNGSLPFCMEAIRLMREKDWSALEMLICRRERRIKGSRYKIGNTKSDDHYNPEAPIHGYRLQFRWGTVYTLVNEILGVLTYE